VARSGSGLAADGAGVTDAEVEPAVAAAALLATPADA
jgi:hypothetical protein